MEIKGTKAEIVVIAGAKIADLRERARLVNSAERIAHQRALVAARAAK